MIRTVVAGNLRRAGEKVGSPQDTVSSLRTFYSGMALAISAVVLVAFSPTYYLKDVFGFRELTVVEHLHGAVASVWLVLFVTQTLLIPARRLALHRRLGTVSVLLAAAMVSLVPVLIARTARTRNATGIEDLQFVMFTAQLFWLNTLMVIGFALFVTLGVCLRRRPEAHKRLMLLAALCVLSPAVGRITGFEVVPVPAPVIVLLLFAPMLAAPIVHDIVVRGRPHPASLLGGPAIFIASTLSVRVLPRLEMARSLPGFF